MKKEIVLPLAIIAIVAAVGILVFLIAKNGQTDAVSVPNSEEMKNRMMKGQGQMAPPSGTVPGGQGGSNRMMQQQRMQGGQMAPPGPQR